jgi:hypothetical protein
VGTGSGFIISSVSFLMDRLGGGAKQFQGAVGEGKRRRRSRREKSGGKSACRKRGATFYSAPGSPGNWFTISTPRLHLRTLSIYVTSAPRCTSKFTVSLFA